ncbi:hypothetical protein AMTRI_Chr06g191030 [Amborella trichopoda]
MGSITINLQHFSENLVMVETVLDIFVSSIPLYIAAFAGLILGWSWRPQWATLLLLGIRTRPRLVWTAPPGFGARRVWLALTALSAFTILRNLWRRSKAWKVGSMEKVSSDNSPANPVNKESIYSDAEECPGVTHEDLGTLISLTQEEDGGPKWHLMMDRSTPILTYQAWLRDPEFGPTQYRSRTIIENVTPELIRDFFWDDEFRTEWDDMLFYFKILQECPQTGTMIIHWIRKVCWKYIFLGDREYIINRRIWEYGRTYYCLTKSTPYRSLPRLRKPRRVDLYYSSWPIRAVKSRKGDGQLTASEVLLFHYEDIGIPKELAKIGIGRAMWGLVRKMEAGVQAYQVAQATGASPSRYALMARINTKISADGLSTNLKDALKQCRSPVT